MRRRVLAACGLAPLFVSLLFPRTDVAQTAVVSPGRLGAARQFREYLQQDWKRGMHEYPEMASDVGFPGESRRWDDHSAEGLAIREKHLHDSLATLLKIQRAELPTSETLNYD